MESRNISHKAGQLVNEIYFSYMNNGPNNHLNDREAFNASLFTQLNQTISQDWALVLTILITFLSLLTIILLSLFLKWYLSMEENKSVESQPPMKCQLFYIGDESSDLTTISISSSVITE